jgi:hypothetical protein
MQGRRWLSPRCDLPIGSEGRGVRSFRRGPAWYGCGDERFRCRPDSQDRSVRMRPAAVAGVAAPDGCGLPVSSSRVRYLRRPDRRCPMAVPTCPGYQRRRAGGTRVLGGSRGAGTAAAGSAAVLQQPTADTAAGTRVAAEPDTAAVSAVRCCFSVLRLGGQARPR